MGVMGEKRPGVTAEGAVLGESGEPRDEVRPVSISAEEIRPLGPPHRLVVESPGRGMPGHA